VKYTPLALINVQVIFRKSIYIKDYTAKLVKTLLINGNPKLEEVFSKGKDLPPKPIHITPLYTTLIAKDDSKGINKKKLQEEKKKAIYTKLIPIRSTAKPPSLNKLKPVRIEAGKKYFFYIGTSMSLLNDVLIGLSNVGEYTFGKSTVYIDSLSYEIRYIDVDKESERIASLMEGQGEGVTSIKITFESPTLLKDPLVIMRRKKKKLLLPLPEAILSTPLLMVLIDKGRLRRSIFLKCMRYIKSVFDIPYTALKTVNLVWYVYDNEVLPAIIGYVKYFIDDQVLYRAHSILKMKYGLDFIEALSRAIILAQVYGVGDGRAAGFGHVSVSLSDGKLMAGNSLPTPPTKTHINPTNTQ